MAVLPIDMNLLFTVSIMSAANAGIESTTNMVSKCVRGLQAAAHRYTVATENLGDRAGLLAAAALTIDYILTAAVCISAGVTALIPLFQVCSHIRF
ncbi:MAG: hypothetical protein QOJ42_6737 [Acidobacteriaceae bacterium]|nr:hypothetical protein [Acidobacteriaceae bacterium]